MDRVFSQWGQQNGVQQPELKQIQTQPLNKLSGQRITLALGKDVIA